MTSAASERSVRLAGLLERARAGEMSALNEVVRELNPLLWHVARTQGLHTDEVLDVVQTAWLELVQRLDEIRTPSAVVGWLVSVTRREAWRVAGKGRRVVPTEAVADSPDPAAGALDVLLDSERDHTLWRYFQQLSERCQRLLRVLTAVDRPDYDEVSRAMGMPRGSIGPTRGRCLAKLRELLLDDPLWGTP
ncbi:RNA polymerase sigma factor [Microbacterium sp.]|uniref:RNA polymerase sigma factor n=1 Tax=Microbacterium sp. TaxID=51671 RepID=UPI0039E6A267